VLSSFATILVVLSAKRTGLLALVSGFCIYLILMINQGHSSKDKFRSILKIALVGCLIYFIAGHFMDSYLANVLNRFRAISEDKGSGRLIIWYLIISQFKQAPIGAKIFGHGFHAVPNFIRPFGKYIFAHNSYIEFLYDLGIVGAIILLSVVINMGVFLLRLIRDKYEIALPAAFAFCVILAFSFASYCFEESNYIMPIAMFWGIIRGYYMKNSKERSIGNQVHGDIDNE
jgi:O-antigen ligase